MISKKQRSLGIKPRSVRLQPSSIYHDVRGWVRVQITSGRGKGRGRVRVRARIRLWVVGGSQSETGAGPMGRA